MSEWGRKGGRGGAGPSGRVRKGWEARPAGASGHHHHVVSHEEGGGQEWLGQTPASFAPAAPSGFPNNCRKCATVSGTWTFGQVVGAGKQKGGKIGPAGLSPTPPPPTPAQRLTMGIGLSSWDGWSLLSWAGLGPEGVASGAVATMVAATAFTLAEFLFFPTD